MKHQTTCTEIENRLHTVESTLELCFSTLPDTAHEEFTTRLIKMVNKMNQPAIAPLDTIIADMVRLYQSRPPIDKSTSGNITVVQNKLYAPMPKVTL